jgi:hypothetical protein
MDLGFLERNIPRCGLLMLLRTGHRYLLVPNDR